VRTDLCCLTLLLAGGCFGQQRTYSIRASLREPVDIDYDSSIAVVVEDTADLRTLMKAEMVYVRAYAGTKAELKKIAGRVQDQRTGCVRYYYHFRTKADMRDGLSLRVPANGNWLNQASGRYLATHWVLVPEDSTLPQGYTWIHEQVVPAYFDGGVEIRVNPPTDARVPPPEVQTAYDSEFASRKGDRPSHAVPKSPQAIDMNAALLRVPYSEPLPGLAAGATVRLKTGPLPPGMRLDAQARKLTGAPTKDGAYRFTLAETGASDITFRIEVEDPARYCIQPKRTNSGPNSSKDDEFTAGAEVEIARCAVTPPIFWHSAADLAAFFGMANE
jgi:hypothetical protein